MSPTLALKTGDAALVDDSDFEMLSRFKWNLIRGYAAKSSWYWGRQQHTYMHRLIMLPDPDQVIDHINGDPLDNRRANLRICSQAENLRNLTQRAVSAAPKGVHWHRASRSWHAELAVDGSRLSLGYFTDPIDAALAYDLAAITHHGEFARPTYLRKDTL